MPTAGREFGSKEAVREYIWDLFEKRGLWRYPPPRGRIPNFRGAEKAALNLSMLSYFKRAKTVFVAPDSPLRPIRRIALESRKTLIVPLPHLVDIVFLRGVKNPASASTLRGIRSLGRPWKGGRVDLVVQGAVAVDLKGWRIGKGRGYGDLEISMLRLRGSISPNTPIVAVVHDIQVFEDLSHLASPNDERITHIVTPTKVIETEFWKRVNPPIFPP